MIIVTPQTFDTNYKTSKHASNICLGTVSIMAPESLLFNNTKF